MPRRSIADKNADPTLEQAAREYLVWAKRRGVRVTTLNRYEQIARVNLAPLHARRLSRITRRDVVALREALYEELAPSSLNQVKVVLAGIYRCARVVRGYEGDDPSDYFDVPRVQNAGDVDVYSPAEVEELIRATRDEREAGIIGVMAYCGLRVSEIRALRWRDVSLLDRSLVVREGYTDVGGRARPKSGKVRVVPMPTRVVELLTALPNSWYQPTRPELLVFSKPVEIQVSPSYIRRMFLGAVERAGLRVLRVHDLRHAYCTMAVRVYPLTDVQYYAGHQDIRTTTRYTHFQPQADAAARMDSMIPSSVGSTR